MPHPVHTFVFTDIEGSTRLWVDHPTSASAAISLHDQILAAVFERFGGRVVKNLEDGLLAVFSDPQAAIEATYIVLGLAAQAGFGAALVQVEILPAWVGQTTLVWSLVWLVVVGLGIPAILFIMPAVIGVVLLFT